MNVSHTFEHTTFLQSATGKGIAGACAWAAIIVTCHQIYEYLRSVILCKHLWIMSLKLA